jgi:AraC-like DNA-binding protein
LNGFLHHNFESEQRIIALLLREGGDPLKLLGINLDTYADVLAPTPFRAMQNGVICLVTVICRLTIALGVPPEQSFALSDYFVCEVERRKSKAQLESLVREVFDSFSDLIYTENVRGYSPGIKKAVRYIQSHLYGCRVSEAAGQAGLNPRYFSSLFKKETGLSPSVYIRNIKMAEAENLLAQGDLSVTAIAENLGYCSLSYFSTEFKRVFGRSPSRKTGR